MKKLHSFFSMMLVIFIIIVLLCILLFVVLCIPKESSEYLNIDHSEFVSVLQKEFSVIDFSTAVVHRDGTKLLNISVSVDDKDMGIDEAIQIFEKVRTYCLSNSFKKQVKKEMPFIYKVIPGNSISIIINTTTWRYDNKYTFDCGTDYHYGYPASMKRSSTTGHRLWNCALRWECIRENDDGTKEHAWAWTYYKLRIVDEITEIEYAGETYTSAEDFIEHFTEPYHIDELGSFYDYYEMS